jgi:predicted nucleic acid-binding protein
MPAAVVDSVVLIDYKDADAGERHDRAERIVRGIDRGDLPTGRVTNYVVLETMNMLHERQHHDVARDLYDRLDRSAGFELVHAAQKDFARAVELFGTYDELAFGDATLVAYMDRTETEYLYSFDDDFDAVEDLARLDTATDPFA